MMKQNATRLGLLFVATIAVTSVLKGQPATTRQSADSATATVELHLKIRDAASGLTLEAKKDVSKGTSGFDGLRGIVAVKYKHFPGLGAFVEELCGIAPANGHFWALYVDGNLSDKGISSIKLEKDTLLEWKTKQQ